MRAAHAAAKAEEEEATGVCMRCGQAAAGEAAARLAAERAREAGEESAAGAESSLAG